MCSVMYICTKFFSFEYDTLENPIISSSCNVNSIELNVVNVRSIIVITTTIIALY